MRILKIGLSIYVFILCLILYSREVYSQVVINEVYPNPPISEGSDKDYEWLELYNISDTPVLLDGYTIEDRNGKQISLNGEIVKWKVFFPKGEGGFALANSDEVILKLVRTDGTFDSFTYVDSKEGKSWGRYPDGGEISSYFMSSSSEATNNLPQTPTPEPTPAPTLQPTPTPTPTKSPTLPPTQKPTATPIVTPKSTLKVTSTPKTSETEETNQEDKVASVVFETSSPSPIGEVAGVSDEQNSFPVVAILPVLVGLGLVGFSGVSLFKRRALIKEFIDSQSNKTN